MRLQQDLALSSVRGDLAPPSRSSHPRWEAELCVVLGFEGVDQGGGLLPWHETCSLLLWLTTVTHSFVLSFILPVGIFIEPLL